MKLLTIIVPSYNMEQYLPKCLGSLVVAPELMEKLEVIVVNDGSKDRTSEIAHEFEEKYPGTFRVIDKENGHYGSCINAALPVATGVYVKVLDADDWFDTENFAWYLIRLSKEDENGGAAVDVIVTDYVKNNFAGEVLLRSHIELQANQSYTLDELARMKVAVPLMHMLTYRRNVFCECGYKQSEGCSYTDNEFAFYPMAKARLVRYWPIPLYQYLIGRGGQSVEQSALDRGSFVFLQIVRRMVNAYTSGTFDKGSDLYLKMWLMNFLHCIYRSYFFTFKIDKIKSELMPFDNWLKVKSLALYEGISLLAHVQLVGRMGFNYVQYIRHGKFNRLMIGLLRIYDCFHLRIRIIRSKR